MDIDSKEISSKQVGGSALITPTAADLLQIIVVADTATSQWQLYDGENTNGDLKLNAKTPYTKSIVFPGGLYMRRGIYFRNQTKVLSALFRWRDRPSNEG